MSDEKTFKGIVTGEIIEVRWAFPGITAGVFKKPGDKVKTGEILASLDRKEL